MAQVTKEGVFLEGQEGAEPPQVVVLQLSFGSKHSFVFLLKPWHHNEVKFEHVLCIYVERDFSMYF